MIWRIPHNNYEHSPHLPFLQISYENDLNVNNGNELTPAQVKSTPTITWSSEPGALYTLLMVDPDAPSARKPIFREISHWMVVNIPGNRVSEGETLIDYIGSGPPSGSGTHRYLFLLYKQTDRLDTTTMPRSSSTSRDHRLFFSHRPFARRHNLNEPVAANFFIAQFDDTVPESHRQMTMSVSYTFRIVFCYLPRIICCWPISLH